MVERTVGRGVLSREEIAIALEGMRCSYSFGMTLAFFVAFLTIAGRGWPSQSTGNPESLLRSIRGGFSGINCIARGFLWYR